MWSAKKEILLCIGTLFLLFSSCQQGGEPKFPKDASIFRPTYSSLFELAFTQTDTFLKLKDPADSTRSIGNFCWGKEGGNKKGFVNVNNRNSFIALSAVFVGMLEALHAENKIIGVDNGNFITSPRTTKIIAKGKIKSVSPNGTIDKEQVANMKPGLLFGYYIDQKGKEELLQLDKQGIPVLFVQNFLEKHPLGRAEWLLVFGALTGNWEKALAQFAEIEEHYQSTVMRAEQAKTKPGVICNAPFTGIWDMPSGDSYMAKLIADAGGNYIYSDRRGAGRIPLDIEKVFTHGRDAEVWLNPGVCRDTNCILMVDKRLAGFKAFQQKNIYNSTKLQNEKGANPWWEYGVLRPDLALLDVFKILHPELTFEHELVFFEKLN